MKKISYNAPFTLTFCLFSLGILIIHSIVLKSFNLDIMQTYFMLFQEQENAGIAASLQDPWTYFRLFSHIAGHKSFSHFMNNFLLILLIGPLLEEKYGSFYLAFMALFNAFITGLIFLVVFKNEALLGASGIVFMMIMMTSFTNKEKSTIPLTLLFLLGLYLGQDIYNMIFKSDSTSQITHLLGGMIGIIAIYFKQQRQKNEG